MRMSEAVQKKNSFNKVYVVFLQANILQLMYCSKMIGEFGESKLAIIFFVRILEINSNRNKHVISKLPSLNFNKACVV